MKFAFLIEPPFNYYTENGIVTGSDVELARTILPMVGIDQVEFIETEFAELLPGVADGRWQMTTGLFATDERREVAAFSRPIWALPDGLLVSVGNPKGLSGYKSIAADRSCRLAVIRDQFQHRSAQQFGVPEERIVVFATYNDAASAVLMGDVDAYASVGRAHTGFIEQTQSEAFEVVTVPVAEKQPAFGSFAFHKNNDQLRLAVDHALSQFLGTIAHRNMMASFGFSDSEIDLVASSNGQP